MNAVKKIFVALVLAITAAPLVAAPADAGKKERRERQDQRREQKRERQDLRRDQKRDRQDLRSEQSTGGTSSSGGDFGLSEDELGGILK